MYCTREKTKCDNKCRFMKTVVLLIMAPCRYQGTRRCFFFTSSNKAVCMFMRHEYRVSPPHAEIMPVLQITLCNPKPLDNLINVAETTKLKVFRVSWKSTKWSIISVCSVTTGTTKANAGTTAALKNASLPTLKKLLAPRFPPISSLPACLLGRSLQLTHWQ